MVVFIKVKALQNTKEQIINYLNLFLKNSDNYLHILPNTIPVDTISSCIVYDTEPAQLEKFPMVIISNGSSNVITGGIGGDFSSELYDSEGDLWGYRYGGMYDLSVTVEVACRTVFEREFLTDLVLMALRVHLRRKLESIGILIKDARTNGESSVAINANKVYITTLTLSIWAEWYNVVELAPIEDVNVNLNIRE